MKHKKKRIVFYALISMATVLLVFDLYCETKGLPAYLERIIERKFQEKGIIIDIKNAKVGVFHGVVLYGVTIKESRYSNWKLLTAENIRFSFPLSFRGINFDRFAIHSGTLSLPMFPETGAEGLFDVLSVQNIEADIWRKGDDLEIKYATASLNGFLLNISGEIKDVFNNAIFLTQGNKTLGENTLKPSSALAGIPLGARTYFYNELRNLKKNSFLKMPQLQLRVNLSLKEIYSSTVNCKLLIPSFKFRNVNIREITGSFSLKDRSVNFENLNINMGKDGKLQGNGSMDLATLTCKGVIIGKMNMEKYKNSLDIPALGKMRLSDKFSDVEIVVNRYSIQHSRGSLQFNAILPDALIYEIPFSDIRINIMLSTDETEKNSVRIDKMKLSFDRGEYFEFNGSVTGLKNRKLTGNMSGNFLPDRFLAALRKNTRESIESSIKIGNEPISFSGYIEKLTSDFKDIHANAEIKIPSVQIRESSFKNISGRLTVNGGTVKGTGFELSSTEGNKLDGEFEYYMPAGQIYVFMHTNGNPSFVYKTAAGQERIFLKTLYDRITWPPGSESVDMTLKAYYFVKEKPFYLLSGNIVVTGCRYNEPSFDYGSCSFLLDSENLVIVPTIILQQGKTNAVISLAYDNRPDGTTIFPSSELFNLPEKKTDRLYFETESALPGNSLLKCIIPDWNSTRVNLAGSCPVKVNGTIDYNSDDNTYFAAKLINGQGEFSGIPMNKVTGSIGMKKQILEITDMTAKPFNGDMTFTYSYNIPKNTGKIALNVEEIEFMPLVKNLGFPVFSTRKTGLLSGDMLADISYGKKDELLMTGNGKISLRDADILEVPILKGFTDMMGKSLVSHEWGEVTSADCTYTLENDHFKTDSIQTDGNTIALSANGQYYWNTSETDFRVRAKLLKNILPYELFSKLLNPLSWVFEARLHGKGTDLKWEQGSGLKKMFK
jgi:hypothetical protein